MSCARCCASSKAARPARDERCTAPPTAPRHAPAARPRPRRRCRAPLRDHHHLGRAGALARTAARRRPVRLRHRDHEPRLHAGRDRRRIFLHRARHRRLRAAAARLRRRSGAARSRARARSLEAAPRGPRARQGRPSSSSTTRTCCATTASRLAGMRFDTMLESYVWNSVATRHDMDSDGAALSRRQRPSNTRTSPARAQSSSASTRCRSTAPPSTSAEDADVTLRLHQCLWPQLEACRRSQRSTRTSSSRCADAAQHGAPRRAHRSRAAARRRAAPSPARCRSCCCRRSARPAYDFNIESPKQLQQILFERLQLPVKRNTPTGQPSTAEDVLEELAHDYELPRIVLDYRTLAKLKVHLHRQAAASRSTRAPAASTPRYHQAVAQTGRLSSVDPNLQNIPIRRAGRPAHPPELHRPARAPAAGGRLLADRAAHHGAPVG